MPQRFWAPPFLGVTSELPMPARLAHSYTGAAVEIGAISAQDGCSGIPSPLFWKWQSMSAVHPAAPSTRHGPPYWRWNRDRHGPQVLVPRDNQLGPRHLRLATCFDPGVRFQPLHRWLPLTHDWRFLCLI